jgi:hypothetical protein
MKHLEWFAKLAWASQVTQQANSSKTQQDGSISFPETTQKQKQKRFIILFVDHPQ